MIYSDIIIIGAGASGLIAARELCKGGKKLIVIEARGRIGGRVHTLTLPGFSSSIEAGAEFIHGGLPITQSLLKEAGIPFSGMDGESYWIKNGKIEETENLNDDLPDLISKLKDLQQDLPFAQFLELYFNDDKYGKLRQTVTRFVEGYDAADINKVSSFALKDEWNNESDIQFRPKGGYSRLIDYLAEGIKNSGSKIYLSRIVKEIKWNKGNAEIMCENGESYSAGKILVTVPVGVLKSSTGNKGHIKFLPEIPQMKEAAASIGFGKVIKIFMEFKEAFWEDDKYKNQINIMRDLSFLISDKPPFTAWWTQFPDKTPMLTGWVGGPKTEELKNLSKDIIKEKAIEAVSYLFRTSESFVKDQLKIFFCADWGEDQFTRGAYAYSTTQSEHARKILTSPVEDTVYFAGEALYEGSAMGTVEAALSSGLKAAQDILSM